MNINGFSSEVITINGIITDDYTNSTIDLTNNEINLNSTSLKYNNNELLTNQDLEIITEKIQNINAIEGKTTLSGELEIMNGSFSAVAVTSQPTFDVVTSPSSYGFRFDLNKNIQIYKIGIHKDNWPGLPATIPYNVYAFPGSLIASFTLDKLTIEGDYYISLIAPTVDLLAGGSYQISIGLATTMLTINNISSYSSIFYNTFGTYTNTPGGAYGNLLTFSAIGNFWFYYPGESSLKVEKINNLTPVGGVYMLTSTANTLSASPTILNLFQNAASVGSLTVPANTFKISSYKLFVSGIITAQKDKQIYFTLKANNIIIGNILTMLIAVTNQTFSLTAYFSIRSIGGPGIANIITSFNFTYSNGLNNFQGDNNQILNNVDFDTTINNTLEVGCQIEAGSTTTIYASQGILKQIY